MAYRGRRVTELILLLLVKKKSTYKMRHVAAENKSFGMWNGNCGMEIMESLWIYRSTLVNLQSVLSFEIKNAITKKKKK